MNGFLILCSLIPGGIGILLVVKGWKKRKQHQLITGLPTTDIRTIDSEESTEFRGEISGPVDGDGFISPIGQADDTVFAAWEVKKWNEGGHNSGWEVLDVGLDAVPFYLDDGTDRVRVEIVDGSDIGSWQFDPFIEEVDVDSDPPAHIRTFVQNEGLSEQSGSIANLVNVGNAQGDRHYSEWALGRGDEVYLLGHVHATEGATTPLHPEDVIVTQAADEPFIISDLSEEEVTHRIGTTYRLMVACGAVAIVLGVGLIVAGMTPLL